MEKLARTRSDTHLGRNLLHELERRSAAAAEASSGWEEASEPCQVDCGCSPSVCGHIVIFPREDTNQKSAWHQAMPPNVYCPSVLVAQVACQSPAEEVPEIWPTRGPESEPTGQSRAQGFIRRDRQTLPV